jgi:hypothetical protein
VNRPPRPGEKPTCAEIDYANAYMVCKRNPTPENEKARQTAYFAANGFEWTPVHCEECGMHRSWLTPQDACRLCGHVKGESIETI